MPSFTQQTQAWADKANKRIDLAVQKIALEAFTRVILRSPVDTGRFRGNWLVSIGSAQGGFTEDVDPSGVIIISDVKETVLTLKAGQTIYLVNNLPYARRLEYGYSTQAPEGMVRITALEFQPIVQAVAEQIRRGS